MKYCLFALLGIYLAAAQSITTTRTTDLNGRTVEASSANSGAARTELSRSVNGRQVPLEQIEERVVRDDANGKVTEKITRKYDPDGRLAQTERVLTNEQRLAGGGSLMHATTYRSDVNGQTQEAERQTIEKRLEGAATHTETTIERPAINGSFQAIEKRSAVSETANGAIHEDETVRRRSQNGDYYQALREVTDQQKTGDQTVRHTVYYEPDVTGNLQPARQTVSTTTKRSDGSEVTEVNLYARSVDGRPQDNQAPQQINEQQVIHREVSGATVTETLSVRRPSIADPGRLGSLQKISETVCTGKCTPEPIR